MYFALEDTPAKKAAFNKKSDHKFGWLKTIPWDMFGIDASDGISHQELINLQSAVGVDADGLIGGSTLRAVQLFLHSRHGLAWNPIMGRVSQIEDGSVPEMMFWNGLGVPLNNCSYNVHTFKDPMGVDLHSAGNFTKKGREISSIVVHWGGLNPQHLGRVFSNRKASSHIAIGRSEDTGEVGIYQYIDLAHITWHAKGANTNSIGIDICQQPEIKHLGYYVGRGYNVETIDNPAHPVYGPAKIISLDPEIRQATSELIAALRDAFNIPRYTPSTEDGVVSREAIEGGGVFSHFHVDAAGQGKWDVAPWWDSIVGSSRDNT